MNLFDMRGAYGRVESFLYDRVVAAGLDAIHDRAAREIAPYIEDGGRMLDVGCGGGRMAAAMLGVRPDIRLHGIDLSPDAIRWARKRTPRATFEVGDAMELPLADDVFDLAFSVASVKHWPDAERGVREMARVVRPGGAVVVLEADSETDHARARSFVEHWRWVLPLARPLAVLYFRRFVAGQGVRAADLESWLAAAQLRELRVWADESLPAVIGTGRTPAP